MGIERCTQSICDPMCPYFKSETDRDDGYNYCVDLMLSDFHEMLSKLENKTEETMLYDNVDQHNAICKELNDLYARKNHDYGDSFHISYLKWGLPMAAIRLGDKYQRFETLIREEQQVQDESIRDTLIDLANYAIMTVMELDRAEKD